MKRRRDKFFRRRLRKVYILPNLFTALNMSLGTLAVMHAIEGRLATAAWLVLAAAFMDGLDGAVARWTNTQSEFGLHLDSLADVVSFGVAPAALAFYVTRNSEMLASHPRLMTSIAMLYVVCGALRLARYNVQASSSERKGFLGLPIPAAGAMVAMTALMIDIYLTPIGARVVVERANGENLLINSVVAIVFPLFVLGIALLMVSETPYPKVTRALSLRGPMSFKTLVSYIMLGVLIWALRSDERVLMLFFIGLGYIGYGLTGALLGRKAGRGEPEAGAGPQERTPGASDGQAD